MSETGHVRRMKTAGTYLDLVGSRWLVRLQMGQVLCSVDADCWQQPHDAHTVANLICAVFVQMEELEL